MASAHLDNELTKLRIDKSKKRRAGGGRSWIVALALAVAGAVAVAFNSGPAPLQVKTVKAERVAAPAGSASVPAGAELLTATGYVIPRDKIEISSKIVGVVKDIFVERGDVVKAGDPILKVEDEEYAAQVKMAEARVATLKASLAELKAGSRRQEIDAAKANVDSMESTVAKSKADLDRMESLAKDKFVSAQELDRMRNAYEVAAANLNSAKKSFELVRIGPRQEVIAAAEARLREAEANLEYARTQFGFTAIAAPISGTILEKLAKKGELVTNTNFGGTRGAKSSVVSMADLDDLQVELDVNEDDINKVKLQQDCKIQLDSHPGMDFKGKVDEIAPQADRQKATVQVKVRVIEPGTLIRPEVNARVTFLADAPPKAEAKPADPAAPAEPKLWVPRAALVNGANGPQVFIVSDGRAVARKVKVGAESGPKAEIADGLLGTESIILEPLDKISDGARVSAP